MTCGIYILKFSNTSKVYIGQSENIEKRRTDHYRNYRKGILPKKLAEAFQLYGYPNVEILIECSKDELNSLENEAIGVFDSVNSGFNTLSRAEDAPTKGSPGELHWNNKYTNEEILTVFYFILHNPNDSLKSVSDELNISYYVVKDVAAGIKHIWLKEADPIGYDKFLAIKASRTSGIPAKARGIKYPKVISKDGTIYEIDNLTQFAKMHNVNSGALHAVLKGKVPRCKGFRLYKP